MAKPGSGGRKRALTSGRRSAWVELRTCLPNKIANYHTCEPSAAIRRANHLNYRKSTIDNQQIISDVGIVESVTRVHQHLARGDPSNQQVPSHFLSFPDISWSFITGYPTSFLKIIIFYKNLRHSIVIFLLQFSFQVRHFIFLANNA